MSADDEFSVVMEPDLARAVREAVAAGEYSSADEALSDAVRVWRREREAQAETLASIKARIQRSIEDPRPSLSGDEVRAQLDALHAETVRTRAREAS